MKEKGIDRVSQPGQLTSALFKLSVSIDFRPREVGHYPAALEAPHQALTRKTPRVERCQLNGEEIGGNAIERVAEIAIPLEAAFQNRFIISGYQRLPRILSLPTR